MKKYKHKPTEVEAYQITKEILESIFFDKQAPPQGLIITGAGYNVERRSMGYWTGHVVTIHGEKTKVVEGDYIVKEPDGEHFYPVKPDIFEQNYDPIL